jgi:hypothetical protein
MQNLPIVITATFTAEPAGGPLSLMLEELNFRPSIAFAPFNQVFQQLLDPASMLASNRNGVNVVLVRLEDWAGNDGTFSEAARGAIERNVADLIAALESDARNAGVPVVVAVGPLSVAAVSDSSFAGFCANVSRQLASSLAPLKNVYFSMARTSWRLGRSLPMTIRTGPSSATCLIRRSSTAPSV